MNGQAVRAFFLGLAGVATLAGLGWWQLQRLAWKNAILAQIDARIAAAPVALPEAPDPARDRYLPVRLQGRFGAGALRVLVSRKQVGAGYRLISSFETGGRRVLVDRGFVRTDAALPAPPAGLVRLAGNLHWPDDRNAAIPPNDVTANIWFARDIDEMAAVLDTEPVLVIARKMSPPESHVMPLPLDSAAISNDHLNYAITWFALAAIWAVMTGVLIRRSRGAGKGAGT